MIIVWILLYWIAGIVIMTVIDTLFDDGSGDGLDGFNVIGSILWPMILVILALVGLYIVIHDSVEKLVKWFKE